MKTITLRNIPPELARLIRRKARRNRMSFNKTVIGLLEESLTGGAAKRRANHDLDWMAGMWSPEEAGEFDRALTEQRRIDPELWK